MVNFLPLDITDEDSVGLILSHVDNAIQYGEDTEPKENVFDYNPNDNNADGDE